jgi:hypothetical protein
MSKVVCYSCGKIDHFVMDFRSKPNGNNGNEVGAVAAKVKSKNNILKTPDSGFWHLKPNDHTRISAMTSGLIHAQLAHAADSTFGVASSTNTSIYLMVIAYFSGEDAHTWKSSTKYYYSQG